MSTPELYSECPVSVTLVQFKDGTWAWNTEENGVQQFMTAQQALDHFLATQSAKAGVN